jgi:hypothetical protein
MLRDWESDSSGVELSGPNVEQADAEYVGQRNEVTEDVRNFLAQQTVESPYRARSPPARCGPWSIHRSDASASAPLSKSWQHLLG